MRKHVSLKTKPYKKVKEYLYQELIRTKENAAREDKKKLNEDIEMFLENPQQMRNTDELFQDLWNIYKKIGYDISRPTSGRDYRTNKIIDMTYEVMTHETTADKMLNPGGFEPQKKMAYLVEAYRNNPHMSWEELSNMTVKQLKKLSYTDKNLTFIDTHIDFYRQNAAAASLIGIFAVANIAHIILQNNRYTLDVNSILMDKSVDIMGLKIEGRMIIDSRFDIEGNSTSKVLGSLVASAADAVKDPVLNLMNINIATVNVLNTLVRLGMPFDKAAMFLSQKSITDILAEFNKENLNSYTSLSQVITARLEKIAEEHNIKSDSPLNIEPITEKEVIKGIRETTPEIEYKTLQALNRILKISTELSSISFATRFNSMSSAVGPLAVDNLITEFKLEDFSEHLYDKDGNTVILKDILERHPILKEFARTLDIARYLLKDMPANSTSFRNILNILDGNLEAIKKDRTLLLKLSDFYQSYILMYNEVINPKDLDYYITKYPTDFINSSYKRDYPDNPFIQAIRTELDPSTGLPALVIDTSGMKTEEKELLTAGWLDLYKNDPETAIQLFEYCFFKGGIGYTPKTFMHLLPMQIKEALKGYKETYSKMPSVSPVLVIDQFVRNNTDNNRLVPYLPKDVKPVYLNKNAFEILDKDAKKLERTKYLKIKTKEGYKVYRQAQVEEGRLIYVEEQVLGSKNAYLEMSSTDIRSSLSETFKTREEESYAEDYGNTQESNESPIEDIPTQYSLDLTEEQKLEFVLQILQNNKQVFNRQQAEEKLQDYKSRYPSRTEDNKKSFKESLKTYIKNRMTQLGLNFNEEIVEDIVSKMC